MATKTLDADDAQERWLDLKPPKYSVSSKFSGDHVLAAANLSKKTSIAAALERYQRNPKITKSSWLLLDDSTILNKARNAKQRASIYANSQQMSIELKNITRRTVTIQELTPKERQRYAHDEIEIKGETRYVNSSSDEDTVSLCCKGEWNPLTGAIEIYHYEESKLPSKSAMLEKFLEWEVDEDEEPIAPVAKK